MAIPGGLVGGSALDDELKRSNVARLRGLPFSASEQDITDFFAGLALGPEGVVIQMNMQGRSTGQAYVQFADAEQANKALEKNRQHIGSRYIEVFKGHPADMEAALRMVGRGGGSSSALSASSGGAAVNGGVVGTGIPGMGGNPDMRFSGVIRMRGMPYSCTNADITAFFKGMPIVADGIFLQTHADGRPTGEAFVEFASEETATRAMQLHREPMGSRYVELFRSTKGEMMTAVQQKMYGVYPGAGGGYNQFGMQQQMNMMSMMGMGAGMGGMGAGMGGMGAMGGLGDPTENVCIKMRGLPYNAGQREIMEFFEGYQVVANGIHVVMNPTTERPTGEAFVEFASPEEAQRAMEKHRSNIGARYIELFRASKSEALLAMGGGALAGFNPAAMLSAMDPNMQLLLLQQMQQQQLAALGMAGNLPAGWGMQDMQNAAAQAAALYQRQAAGAGAGGAGYTFDPASSGQ
eukprot:TRINITY_DN38855_c0_g1_i1.p1 TRINITY_DN38855_c0_g1~~TRINITY_DN38855_c0_g1_i1.p1  ORF type:complete len:464 (-),score=107.18 TRINITY_DN38855_c0_g1_i1:590-1981(-)